MSISEEQLQTWTNAPSSVKSKFTHEEVRKALEKSDALKYRSYDVYLQGSYANSTNTKVDSDVDVVVQLNSTYSPDVSQLSIADRQLFNQVTPNATYQWADFRRDVLAALTSHFGILAVRAGTKSIKIAGSASRVNADVVPCLQHRRYLSFATWKPEDFVEGMKFWTTSTPSAEIINYPKLHLKNGEEKNAQHRTSEKYKHMVRIMKNIRRNLVEKNGMDPKLAPSYFLECAIYNAPDGHFQTDYKTGFEYVLDHILHRCDPNGLVTVSHQHALFGTEPWQWNQANAAAFFQAVQSYYLSN